MALGEHFIDVFLDDPRRAHPPTRHLVNNHVSPEVFFDLFSHVIAFVDVGHLDFEPLAIKKSQGRLVQGQVVTTIGMREFFSTVKQQNFLHHQPRQELTLGAVERRWVLKV